MNGHKVRPTGVSKPPNITNQTLISLFTLDLSQGIGVIQIRHNNIDGDARLIRCGSWSRIACITEQAFNKNGC